MATLTLDEVLDVEYPGPPAWGGAGDRLAALVYEDDGNALLVAVHDDDGGAQSGWTTSRYRPGDGHVTEFAWHPDDATIAVTTDEGELHLLEPDAETHSLLVADPDGVSSPTWAPDGDRLAVYRGGRPTVVSPDSGPVRTLDVPAFDRFLPDDRMLAWNDAGTRLAVTFVDRETTQVGVASVPEATLEWRSTDPAATGSPQFLGDGRLLVDRTRESGTVREVVAVDLAAGDESVLVSEVDSERGTVSMGAPTLAPDGDRVALALPFDGWEHVYVVDATTGERTQLTSGEFEDKGLAGSAPRWLGDDHLVFASNRRDPGQRQVFAVAVESGAVESGAVESGAVTPLVESAGTNVYPRPSPGGDRLAYVHADRDRSAELRVRSLDEQPAATDNLDEQPAATDNLDGQSAATDIDVARLTESAVDDWPVAPIPPDHVTVESHDGTEIHGYLIDPRGESVRADATDLPAIVWVHGGPMRQMRDGWHPSRSYGLAYTAHQFFAHRGYVGLLVNYRGGIGYGREFRQAIADDYGRDEMKDIVSAADSLKAREFVDGSSVGVWGLSYGGYAVLQLLGTHPEVFAAGVNLAGLADLQNFHEWVAEQKYPAVSDAQEVVFGGDPWDAPDEWDAASPVTHMHRYERPLYTFHGTGDRYVNVEQQDIVVDELLELGKEFEAEYYPDEGHVYSKRAVWERTLRKVTAAFDDHL